ncbi:uncharacterized protein LOC119746330 [Patiria miniata]|uniref:Uncharacterized protein n=1 Tax=Patiria miniata TaxID=46514 RepID=A0A914BTV9_PATMI|nr:uncharacterized protein LOC119746330 [Patiria miniata]
MNSILLATSVLVLMAPCTMCTSTSTNNADKECFECYGVMGERTDCGATLSPDDVVNTTRCAYSCAKVLIYMMDQKIAISRECVEHCEDGCVKDIASHCYYCCNSTLCNSTTGLKQTPKQNLYARLIILPLLCAVWN